MKRDLKFMKNHCPRPRILNRLSGWVEVIRNSDERIEVFGIAIGQGGIKIISPTRIDIEEQVTLILHFVDHQVGNVSESVRAIVTWIKPIEEKYGIDLKFGPLDPNNQALVLSYIKSRQNETINE